MQANIHFIRRFSRQDLKLQLEEDYLPDETIAEMVQAKNEQLLAQMYCLMVFVQLNSSKTEHYNNIMTSMDGDSQQALYPLIEAAMEMND